MNSKNEKIILKIIKYGPPLLILALSFILTISLYYNNQVVFQDEKKLIELEHIQKNKELIKSQIDRTYNYIIREQSLTENNLKNSLKQRVQEAYNIAQNIYKNNQNLDNQTIQKLIVDAIRTIRFNNNRGYFFIYTMKGKNILNAAFPSFEGKTHWNYQDAKGVYLIQEMNKILKTKKEVYYDWYWFKPDDKEKTQYKKIGFFKKFEPFDWFIGTGEYIEDFEKDVKENILSYIHHLKYPKNGYIFVLDFKGNYLNHIRKDIIGLNALEAKDTRSHQTILNAINLSKNNGYGYITYIQTKKPGIDLPTKKTSYIKGFEQWQWLIGKGFYEDDIQDMISKQKNLLEKKFQSNLRQIILTTIILTMILLFFSIKLSKVLQKRFSAYQNEIEDNLKKITQQQNILAHQSKMAAIGTMIGNIAHQWRQPLSMISSASTGMKVKNDVGILNNDEFNKSINYINNATQYLSKTIDDFRNFFSENKEKVYFTIKEAIDSSLNIVKAQFNNHDIEIITNVEEIKIFGLKNELIQVIINILNNSKDEFEKKKYTNKWIIIDSYLEQDHLILNITDNAGGVPENIIEHIFEPYFTTKHQSQGTGIGLYMSQEIITKHMNGSINISNCKFDYEGKNYTGAKVTIKLKIE